VTVNDSGKLADSEYEGGHMEVNPPVRAMRRPTIERRLSARSDAHGMALLVFGEAQQHRVTGVLVNAGGGGFCLSHPFPDFKKDDVVLFLHPLCEGAARVVWTRAAAADFLTGFAYLSASSSE
jgi:hypothetical protein